MRTKMFLVGAMVAAGAGILAATPATAATAETATPRHSCTAVYTNYDPDQGAGAGYSHCGPMDAIDHRVKLTCFGNGAYYTAYGDWKRGTHISFTTCFGGHVAYGVTYELR